MKISPLFACLALAFAASAFAQSSPSTASADLGAKLVAQRDAAWSKSHPGSAAEVLAPQRSASAKPVKPAKHGKLAKHKKHAKQGMHVKHGKSAKHAKHAKQAKHAKLSKHKAGHAV